MSDNPSDRLYDLEFSVEVSTLYHDWRRASLEFWAGFIKLVTLAGVIITFTTAFLALSDNKLVWLIILANVCVATVTAVDLTFRIDSKARLHTALFQRFKRLQAEIAKRRTEAVTYIDEWNAEAQTIRIDEPAVLWMIYMRGWNQVLAKRNVHPGYSRRITPSQAFWGRFRQYRPEDFPVVGAST